MPEEIKKRGRPKKKEVQIINEEVDKVTMAKKQYFHAEVGQVQQSPETVTLDALQNRWRQVLKRYSSMGYENIANAWSNINGGLVGGNPFTQNMRVKQINSPARKLTKEQLEDSLEDPATHEDTLRSISMYLYYTNYIYQTLVQLNRNTPKYNWYVTPLYIEDGDQAKLKEESIFVDKLMKKFNPQLTFKTISTQVSVEGKSSYLVRTSYNKKDVDFLLLQKLNSDNVKVTGFGSKQQFIISFNMNIFLRAGYDINQYPPFIQETWKQMMTDGIVIEGKNGNKKLNPKAQIPIGHMMETDVNGNWFYWVKLPQSLAYTFYSDGSNPNVFPDFVGLFQDLNDLDSYRWLQGSLASKGVNAIMTAEVPLVKDTKPGGDQTAISPDTILGYTSLFESTVSENVLPFFGPMTDFELHTVEAQPQAMSILYDHYRNLVATSGQGALLNVTDRPSIAATQAAEKLQAAKNDYVTKQFEQFLNQVINENYDLKNYWNVTLWGDIFTQSDEISTMKELIISGAKGMSARLLSAFNYSLEDYKGSDKYLSALGIDLIPKPDPEKALTSPVGRPAKKDDEVDNDNTGESKNTGANVSSTKTGKA